MSVVSSDIDPKYIFLNFTLPGYPDEIQSVQFGALEEYITGTIQRCIAQGVSIGLLGVALIILLLINAKKKKTPAFYLNTAVLFVGIIRAGLYLGYLLGPLNDLSFTFTGLMTPENFKLVQLVTAADSMYVIFILLIEILMTYQIYIVFKSPEVHHLGVVVTLFSALLAASVVVVYVVISIQNTTNFNSLINSGHVNSDAVRGTLAKVGPILFLVLVNVLSFLLLVKLAFAIRTRRYLGLRQFDSLHILVIMTTQTLIVPSIISFVNYGVNALRTPALFQMQILLVVLSLPLSSIWAMTANNIPKSPYWSSSDVSSDDNDTFVGNSHLFFPRKLTFDEKSQDDFSSYALENIPNSAASVPLTLQAILTDKDSSLLYLTNEGVDLKQEGFISVHQVTRKD